MVSYVYDTIIQYNLHVHTCRMHVYIYMYYVSHSISWNYLWSHWEGPAELQWTCTAYPTSQWAIEHCCVLCSTVVPRQYAYSTLTLMVKGEWAYRQGCPIILVNKPTQNIHEAFSKGVGILSRWAYCRGSMVRMSIQWGTPVIISWQLRYLYLSILCIIIIILILCTLWIVGRPHQCQHYFSPGYKQTTPTRSELEGTLLKYCTTLVPKYYEYAKVLSEALLVYSFLYCKRESKVTHRNLKLDSVIFYMNAPLPEHYWKVVFCIYITWSLPTISVVQTIVCRILHTLYITCVYTYHVVWSITTVQSSWSESWVEWSHCSFCGSHWIQYTHRSTGLQP